VDVRNLSGKTAMVTGAGSGIGRETALEVARRGGDLFLCDVNEAGLKQTEEAARALGRSVLARRVDVARTEQMRGFAEEVHSQVDGVDLLVNNAGVGVGGRFQDTTLEDWSWIVGINLMGVVHGCHFFVPRMVERGQGGHVANVASMAGYVVSDSTPAYSATKFAVIGLSESLRLELAPARIGVSAICPGIINTPIVASSPLRGEGATEEMRERMVEMYRRRNYGPERVARNILRAVQRNRMLAPISPEAWAFYYLKRWAPWLVRALAGWQSRTAQRQLEKNASS
jgi:NAD(P)-dependent dehydrogenase (short-subunit alcohol dehydrogenase family)